MIFLKLSLDLSLTSLPLNPGVMFVFALIAQGRRGTCIAGPALPSPALSVGPRTVETPALAQVPELGACLLFLGDFCSKPPQWEGFPFLLHEILWEESHCSWQFFKTGLQVI